MDAKRYPYDLDGNNDKNIAGRVAITILASGPANVVLTINNFLSRLTNDELYQVLCEKKLSYNKDDYNQKTTILLQVDISNNTEVELPL